MNLNGIADAHRDVRLGFAFEIGKFTAGASAAVWVAGDADGLKMTAPDITRDETAMQRIGAAGQKLDGFSGFERGDEIDDGAEDAYGIARFLQTPLLRFCQTGETRGRSGTDGHGETVAGHGGRVNPRLRVLHGEIVDQKARLEVVCPIENDVEAREQVGGGGGAEVSDDPLNGHAGIDRTEFAFGGNGFWKSGEGVGFIE